VKIELDKQLAAARIINKSQLLLATKLPLSRNQIDTEDDEDDFDHDDTITMTNLLDDLAHSPNDCAFPSSTQTKCLTNNQVYRLIKNKSDLMKISKTIDKQLHKPNEHMCTSIDLSMYSF
jgi:hypothetical protein